MPQWRSLGNPPKNKRFILKQEKFPETAAIKFHQTILNNLLGYEKGMPWCSPVRQVLLYQFCFSTICLLLLPFHSYLYATQHSQTHYSTNVSSSVLSTLFFMCPGKLLKAIAKLRYLPPSEISQLPFVRTTYL